MKKAVFLDRDGVIIVDKGYIYKKEDVEFVDGIFDFCKNIQDKEYLIIVITNQSGVARGYYTEQNVQELHEWMSDIFLEKGIAIAGFYYCPFHTEATVEKYKEDSEMRKPNPGMILKAADDFNIAIEQSFMIGDQPSDRIKLDDLKSIILKSKYSKESFDANDFNEALSLIFTC